MFNQIIEDSFNNTVRKHVIAFGSLFNSIYVQTVRSSGIEKTRVPLSYGPKEKFIQRIISESGITDQTHLQMSLPRMGFEMGGLQYDPSRRINKLKKIEKNTNGKKLVSYSESPYIYSFNLYIFTRSSEHNFQIIEQIVPFFTPDFTVTMNMNELFTKVDVPIVLSNTTINEEYEGEFDNRRSLISVMNFTMKGYIYSPIKENDQVLIEEVDINFYDGSVTPKLFLGDVGYTGDIADYITTGSTGSIKWSPGNTG